jgi:hypothetical protein
MPATSKIKAHGPGRLLRRAGIRRLLALLTFTGLLLVLSIPSQLGFLGAPLESAHARPSASMAGVPNPYGAGLLASDTPASASTVPAVTIPPVLTPSPVAESAFEVVISPSAGADQVLNSVAAISTNDVWAAGYYITNTLSSSGTLSPVLRTLVQRWDGTRWTSYASPNEGSDDNVLRGVSAVSSQDAWAVGEFRNSAGVSQTLTLHWDGSNWLRHPSPNHIEGSDDNVLRSVSAVSANDVWAVGSYYDAVLGREQTLTMHWNGLIWSIVQGANVPGVDSVLYAVDAIASDDVWAVGAYRSGAGWQTLILHGGCIGLQCQWSIVPSESRGSDDNVLRSVSAVSADNVWAVGSYYDAVLGKEQTLTMHWNGGQWSVVNSPNYIEGSDDNVLRSVNAIASDDVWAVGTYVDSGGALRTLTMHWNGVMWTVINSPNQSYEDNVLSGVAAISSGDVWAVGDFVTGIGNALTLTMHWNGGEWRTAPSPNPGALVNYLQAIAPISANDVWAVGYYYDVQATVTGTLGVPPHTLIEHWDGKIWSVVPSPDYANEANYLTGAVAISANDVWAVGSWSWDKACSTTMWGCNTLTMHWDGEQWSIVPSPNAPNSRWNHLHSISAISAGDIWAVGQYGGDSTLNQTLTLHWTCDSPGQCQWRYIDSPDPDGCTNCSLQVVGALASGDVWTAGNYYTIPPQGGPALTLIEHWDGEQWSLVPSPNDPDPGAIDNDLWGLVALSPEDIWAVGGSGSDCEGTNCQPLTLHWSCPPDNQCGPNEQPAWRIVDSPLLEGTKAAELKGVTARSPSDVWAAGTKLVMHWNGSSWSIVTGPNIDYYLSAIAVVPGSTDIWSVGFQGRETLAMYHTDDPPPPTATPQVPCTLQFTDVAQGSAFYPYVRCLVCGGIISGYPCGSPGEPCGPDSNPYFRPGNNVTRGQIAKIVSNSAGYLEDPGQQIYEDVPSSNPFYRWINRLSRRGHMSGYPCGDLDEPCGPDKKPYFRPGSSASRGQLAKIVSNAAGLEADPDPQVYEDVPPSSPFYPYINRLSRRGVMGGYPCGGEGEPTSGAPAM